MDCTEAPHSHRIYSCSLPCPQSKRYSNKDKKMKCEFKLKCNLICHVQKDFAQISSYLQAGWWVRSHAPPRSFPSWCRCTFCTASTGQSGLPRRSDWLYPPAGWALPNGPLPLPWTCKPYPPEARRWKSLSLCACACFQVMRFLFSQYSSPDINLLNLMFCNVDTLVCVPGASFLSDCSKLPTKSLLLFSLCTRLVSSLCASGSKGKGPDCSVLVSSPLFPTHYELLHNSGAASLDLQLLR